MTLGEVTKLIEAGFSHDEIMAFATDPAPAPATDPTPAPATDPTPAPATDPTPAPATDPTPAPATDLTPAPATDLTPAPATDLDSVKTSIADMTGTMKELIKTIQAGNLRKDQFNSLGGNGQNLNDKVDDIMKSIIRTEKEETKK